MRTTNCLLFLVAVGVSSSTVFSATGRGDVNQQGARKMSVKDITTSRAEKNIQVMAGLFRAIEQRDPEHPRLDLEAQFYTPDVEFNWPPSLPYGGTSRGLKRAGPAWSDTWNPLQPTAAERRMDPRFVAANDTEVVVLYHQRGVSPSGERFDGEVLGLYELRESKLARAQMFHFDEAALVRFLANAKR
jgi:ketosteroid isomerase-like protein